MISLLYERWKDVPYLRYSKLGLVEVPRNEFRGYSMTRAAGTITS